MGDLVTQAIQEDPEDKAHAVKRDHRDRLEPQELLDSQVRQDLPGQVENAATARHRVRLQDIKCVEGCVCSVTDISV